ncbi:MAG: hypothetical protein H0U70_09585 [Tatlockia sp.]|nr:hypothetical protein [Tatlockia sp.]
MLTKKETSSKPSLLQRLYSYFFYTEVSLEAKKPINFAKIDKRIEFNGHWLESYPSQVLIRIPKDFAQEVILKLRKDSDITDVSEPASQIVWLRLITPLIYAGICTILGAILGTFVFPGLGTLAGASIGGCFGAGSGLFIVGLNLSVNSKIVKGALSSVIGAMIAGAAAGALVGTVVPGLGNIIGTLIGATLGFAVGIFSSLVIISTSKTEFSAEDIDETEPVVIENYDDESIKGSSAQLAALGGSYESHYKDYQAALIDLCEPDNLGHDFLEQNQEFIDQLNNNFNEKLECERQNLNTSFLS